MDSLALRLPLVSIREKHWEGSSGQDEREVDIYPSDSALLPTRPREARDDITCDFILLLPAELQFSMLKPTHSGGKTIRLWFFL